MLTRIAGVLMVLVALLGCSSLEVQSEWDREVDFSEYKTFAWLDAKEGKDGYRLEDHLDRRLRRVVTDVLIEKGLEPAPVPPAADLFLTYYISLEKEMRVDLVGHESYGGYGYGYWPSASFATARMREYATGTLVFDVIDRESEQLVWMGFIQGAANNPNPSGDRIQAVMEQMLEGFPPS